MVNWVRARKGNFIGSLSFFQGRRPPKVYRFTTRHIRTLQTYKPILGVDRDPPKGGRVEPKTFRHPTLCLCLVLRRVDLWSHVRVGTGVRPP